MSKTPTSIPGSNYGSSVSNSGSEKNNQVLNDIRGKIDRERKIIQGFQAMKKNTNNVEVIQKCNNQIRETQSNIDYLQETLAKLSLQQESNDEDSQSGTKSRPIYTRFDLTKYDGPSMGHRIQYMLQQLQFKLQVENQYKQANEKISQLYLLDGDKSSSVAAEGGKLESDQRIQLLNKALKRYQDMHVDIEEVTKDMEIMNTPKYSRKPLTGKLYITVTCVKDIDHITSPMFSKKPESVVSIKVDDVEKVRSKGSRTGKWNEEFVIDIDKGNEIEFSVYDKSSTSLVPVAVTWALLSDITEELRKKKVANELGNEGWVSASNYSANDFSAANNSSLPPDSGFNSATSASTTSTNDNKNVQVNTWLNLEPVGQILVSLSFDKSQSGRKQFMGGLGRQGAIRQKKEEVFDQHGHQFVQKPFYNIMCCSLCGEFLRYTGFQCQDCKLLCHKKCYQKVVTKCISKSSTDYDDSDEAKLNHRIPHRFEPALNRGTKWCCHCGYILPWGRKNVRKCTECGVMCHAHCTHLVPDFCGMSMDMANKILATIKSTPKPVPKANVKPIKTINSSGAYSGSTLGNTSGTTTPIRTVFPQDHTPSSKTTLPTIPSHAQTNSDVRDFSDDEYENNKLPTMTSNQYQSPVKEHPYKQQAHRRPPPPPQQVPQEDINRQSMMMDPGDYTFASTKSEEMLPAVPQDQYGYEEPNPFEPSNNQFQNFDYHDQQTMPLINEPIEQHPPEPPAHQSALQQQHIPAPPQTSSRSESPKLKDKHKSKKRRRKIGLDDFQFLAVLGKGNFGKVMLAESRHTSKLCAIKVLKKDFIVENDEAESVRSEKNIFLKANKENHPFLLNLHCCFQTENRIYFVMEYVSGGDLMWHIQKSRFSAKRAKFYACEVLLGLQHLHQQNIVYRDLKLDNILLTYKGHIKIADYGLCKENMGYENTTGTFCGTPEFMAPEIISGKQYDRSVDWWAFGVLLFQMLLCQSPFKGDDQDEVFNAIEHDDVKYPISMPRQTVLILQALLTKDPTMRLGSSERDALDIMEHPYFQDVNFDDVLHCRIQPPYLPELSSEHDYSNFDKEFTSETPRLTPVDTVLTSEMQEQFRGFSHISEDAVI
ncbi:protein kinase C-like 1 [[Candida] jaroonii]|uniref:Protein kinase C-like 1 n=1 Tax=[Candida] jaroonii TaxID=467808 RepID=A0ACA9YAJ3_9ASCO|nr:protein kinase C-like 1 [[Candida] jaroonii]